MTNISRVIKIAMMASTVAAVESLHTLEHGKLIQLHLDSHIHT